ncbi:hypothetical protein ACHHYP_06013 [Achlya hypogyna]|uniref:Uncharacterized protein n=1 Tax=Achlya hypogyna TaxID=1202772 RepID=A0A1V9ZNB9_ACHHY|nr:hypothetical protein ACHHYP_06013 [Achlya hypogyna]
MYAGRWDVLAVASDGYSWHPSASFFAFGSVSASLCCIATALFEVYFAPTPPTFTIHCPKRKYGTVREQRLQRALRLSAMFAEWFEFTTAPLSLAFVITGTPGFVHQLLLTLNSANEVTRMRLVYEVQTQLDGQRCYGNKSGSSRTHQHAYRAQYNGRWCPYTYLFLVEPVLESVLYPLAFDLLYIPMVSTFLRLGSCPIGLGHLVLPGGITCDCIDRFGIFWAVGLLCFILHYCGALHHKMNIEPLASTMDFRFQPSYQFFIVMARTLCPVVSILMINLEASRTEVVALCLGLLLVWTLLLGYSYKTQPCIGSGSSPNNLRVVTCTGAVYSTLCAIGVLTVQASLTTLLFALVPLPGVWMAAWAINDRRARLYDVPNVPIVELLHHPAPITQTVGSIAAMYMNPRKVVDRDHERIITQLRRLAATASDASCRMYALRTLWFCHIRSYMEAPKPTPTNGVPGNLWLKDRGNTERPPRTPVLRPKRIKLAAIGITDARLHVATARQSVGAIFSAIPIRSARSQGRNPGASMRDIDPNSPYYIVSIGGSLWISHRHTPTDAVLESHRLYVMAVDAWSLSVTMRDTNAMYEASLFLLQWYRTGCLELPPDMFLRVLAVLCKVGSIKMVIDATHSLYNATLNGVTPPTLWWKYPRAMGHFSHGLRLKSRATVAKCAAVLAITVANPTELGKAPWLTPKFVVRVESALRAWVRDYRISDSLSKVYGVLQEMHPNTALSSSSKRLLLDAMRRLQALSSKTIRSLSRSGISRREPSKGYAASRQPHELSGSSSALIPKPLLPNGRVVPAPILAADVSALPTAAVELSTTHSPMLKVENTTSGPSISAVQAQLAAAGPSTAILLEANVLGDTTPCPTASATGAMQTLLRQPKVPSKTHLLRFDKELILRVEEHRIRRNQFVEILRRAYSLRRCVADGRSSARQVRTKRFRLVDAVECAVALYQAPDDCGIVDYVDTVLDRAIREFFMPYVAHLSPHHRQLGGVINWADCGFEWLHVAPIASFCLVWIVLGIRMLHRSGAAHHLFRRDPSEIHDHIAQGVAIALAQRKYGSLRVQQLQRMLRLSAMWSEWLEFTLAPLNIAFMVTGSPSDLYSQLFTLNTANERVLYPLVFDVCYISMTATFLRVGTCPLAVAHLHLLGKVSCDCIDHFGIFWVVGLGCFILHYCGALHHKMNIEPLATTMDFRFQPSYQFFIVMARTEIRFVNKRHIVGPIAAIIVMNIGANPAGVLVVLFGLLVVWTLLLLYSYSTQPCIGSGSGPNNIRVVTFSSAIYTTMCSISVVVADESLRTLLLTLIPLPLVWLTAWHVNRRRAELYHIPNVSILDLLRYPSPAIATVGAVAALHMNPKNVIARDHKPIIDQLRILSSTAADPTCRIYALRTLWFCALKSFLDAERPYVGEVAAPLPRNAWKKDRSNPDRPGPAAAVPAKRAKLMRVTDRFQLSRLAAARRSAANVLQDLASKSRFLDRAGRRATIGAITLPPDETFQMIGLRGHVWISETLAAEVVVGEYQRMYAAALRALQDSVAIKNRGAMLESATFLLQWYRTGYVRLSRDSFLQVLSVLCMVGSPKIVMDATNSLHVATLNKVIPEIIWLQHSSYLNTFTYALRTKSKVTVGHCAAVLVRVVETAQQQQRPIPLTRRSLKRRWHLTGGVQITVSAMLSSACTLLLQEWMRKQGRAPPLKKQHLRYATNLGAIQSKPPFHALVSRRSAAINSLQDWTQQLRTVDVAVYKDMARMIVRPKCTLKLYNRHETPVNPEVLAGVERRQAQRRQFIEILERAYSLYLNTMDETRPRSKRFGFQDAIDAVIDLYNAPHESSDWTDCGFGWLHLAPISTYWCVWMSLGIYMLQRNGALRGLFHSDASTIHDHVAQGIAIALSQRKYGSLRQQKLQRALRLSAMWAEWLEFTLVPLELAFKLTGTPAILHTIEHSFNFTNESLNLAVAMCFGGVIVVFHHWTRCTSFTYHSSLHAMCIVEPLLDRIVYPLAFDLLYIPIVAAFLRLGTCPLEQDHVALPGGATCDCVDRFGIFWAVGLVCFVLHYCFALHHKMVVEPLATTMDFRFQRSYQFFIVMARTCIYFLIHFDESPHFVVCPLVSVLAVNMEAGRDAILGISLGLLIVWVLLVSYSYKTQPVRSPNNIRVLTFSGAIYTTVCSMTTVITGATLDTLLFSLIPLPLVWTSAWHINSRRARRFHIPNVSILELLQHSSPTTRLVGTIAALYTNPQRIVERDHEPIISRLGRLAAIPGDPLCRIYAIRVLWFCHIEMLEFSLEVAELHASAGVRTRY